MKTIKLQDLKKELDILTEMEGQDNQNIDNANTVNNDGVSTEIVSDNEIDAQNDNENNENNENKKTTSKPSKFKSVEELEKAYNELEKEFTRRSQKLAKYEKEGQAITESPEQWKAKVDKFFDKNPDAKPFARQMAEKISQDTSLRQSPNCLENALTRVLLDTYRTPGQLASDKDFLEEHILGSDFVKKAVIDRYIKDLREGKPPMLISQTGQNTVAPRNKPKTVAEAGRLFQQNYK